MTPDLAELADAWRGTQPDGANMTRPLEELLSHFGHDTEAITYSALHSYCHGRWSNPNTARNALSIMRRFLVWAETVHRVPVGDLARPFQSRAGERVYRRGRRPPAHPAVQAFADYQVLRGFRPMTVRRRTWTLNAWLDVIGPDRLWSAELAEVEAFLAARPSSTTRRHCLYDLRTFYRWAIARDHCDTDPTALVDSPRVPKRAPTPVPTDQVLLALDRAKKGTEVRLMIALGAYAGLRVSEIAAVSVEWFDIPGRQLTVRDGKGGRDRRVPLGQTLRQELLNYNLPATGRLWPYDGGMVWLRIRRHFDLLGISYRPHDLRASFATRIAQVSNGNVLAVSQLLGHESIETSMRYIGYRPELEEFVGRLDITEAAS